MNFIDMNKTNGFSLAEVLITLGAISIVAVMTIPSLMIHINTTKFRTQYKKTLSNLNQAALNAETNFDLNFAAVTSPCVRATDDPRSVSSVCGILNGTLTGATYYSQAEISSMGVKGVYSPQGTGITSRPKAYYMFADGSLLGFDTQLQGCTLMPGQNITTLKEQCYGFIDVNGTTAPNKAVECSIPTSTKITNDQSNCTVRNNSVDMGDVFPVALHDSTVEPLTNAARYVLNQSIMNTKD